MGMEEVRRLVPTDRRIFAKSNGQTKNMISIAEL